MPLAKQKKNDGEDDQLSPSRLEFEGQWISYKILYERVREKNTSEILRYDGRIFAVFFFAVLLMTISLDTSSSNRAAAKLVVYETVIQNEFRSGALSVGSDQPHLINFYNIHTREDFERWLHDVLRNQIYIHDNVSSSAVRSTQTDMLIHGTQSMLWGISLRQQRVKSSSELHKLGCCIPNLMDEASFPCMPSFGSYGASKFQEAGTVESTQAYGYCNQNGSQNSNATCSLPFIYKTGTEIGKGGELTAYDLHSGFLSSYDGGGFEIVLPKNSSVANSLIESLLGPHGSSRSLVPYLDKNTRLVVVTLQTYTVHTNVFLRCDLIVEFDSTGAASTKLNVRSSNRWLNRIFPSGDMIFLVICEFAAAVLATFLLLQAINHFELRNIGIFELGHLASLVAVITYLGLSCYKQLFGSYAPRIRSSLREPGVSGMYLLNFATFKTKEEVMLVTNLLNILQIFRYVPFFKSLKLVDGACKRLGWGLILVVAGSVTSLFVFALGGVLMFSEFDANFSSLSRSFITLTRCYFGTFKFDDAYKHDQGGTFVFVLVFYWVSIILMTVLSSAILIDGIRMQAEFGILQRKGLSKTSSQNTQKAMLHAIRKISRCLCYRYGCWRSELCQSFIYSWCSYRKWFQWSKSLCASCSSKSQTKIDMSITEVMKRLAAWKAETANQDILYMNFDHILEAMRGDNRNRRVVEDHEVGSVLTLCYVDPKLKGESYFRTTKEKEEYEKAERAGGAVFENIETEGARQQRSLKKLFSGIRKLSFDQSKSFSEFKERMDSIQAVMRRNDVMLNTCRLRYKQMQTT